VAFARDSIETFAAAVGERSPAPASGSALAVAGALAAALVELTARFSGEDPAEAVRVRERLLALADEDAAAYTEFMRTKSDEARERTIAVPQELADLAGAIAETAVRLEREGNPYLEGDATAARLLAEAAQRAATRLVELNRAAGS
jgi:methenyltetrahydrofolate cyclohydrolase